MELFDLLRELFCQDGGNELWHFGYVGDDIGGDAHEGTEGSIGHHVLDMFLERDVFGLL